MAEDLGDGVLTVAASVPETAQLTWWLLGFGENVEVLAPAELREQMRASTGKWQRFTDERGCYEPSLGNIGLLEQAALVFVCALYQGIELCRSFRGLSREMRRGDGTTGNANLNRLMLGPFTASLHHGDDWQQTQKNHRAKNHRDFLVGHVGRVGRLRMVVE